MEIQIVSGTGEGPTKLAAFDAALINAGVANFNLIRLSSIIPAKSNITVHDKTLDVSQLPGFWGDRLYVVVAESRIDEPGAEAWAGIGWVQDRTTSRGLFVEHEGMNEQAVRGDITLSLEAMMASRDVDFGPIQMKVIGRTCTSQPVCSLAIAVYQASSWQNEPRLFRK